MGQLVRASLLGLAIGCSLACGPSQTIEIEYPGSTNPWRTLAVSEQAYCDTPDGILVHVQDGQSVPWWRGGIGGEPLTVDLFALADCGDKPGDRRALEAGTCTWRALVTTRSLGRVHEFTIPRPTVSARFVPSGLLIELDGEVSEGNQIDGTSVTIPRTLPSTVRIALTVTETKGMVERVCSWMAIPPGIGDFLGCSKKAG